MKYKSKPDKEQLRKDYEELGSTRKIGGRYRVSQRTICRWMKKDKIKRNKSDYQMFLEKRTKENPSEEQLRRDYERLGSTKRVGEKYRVHKVTILNWMKNYGIERNKSAVQISKEKKPSKEELEAKYKEIRYNAAKLGRYYDVSTSTALDWIKKDGVKIEKIPSKEELQKKYRELGSTTKLGEFYKIAETTSCNWMKKYGIKRKKSTRQIYQERPSKEELEVKCKELGYNTKKVGEFYSISNVTALIWMKDYEIKTKKSSVQISKEKKPSKEELQRKYDELGSIIKLGNLYDVSETTALNWLKSYKININKSCMQISKEKKPSKEELQRKYDELGSARKLGKFYRVSNTTPLIWMEEYGIEKRKKREKPSKEEFEAKYQELEHSTAKLGKFYKVNRKTISNWMTDYRIAINKRNRGCLEKAVEEYMEK